MPVTSTRCCQVGQALPPDARHGEEVRHDTLPFLEPHRGAFSKIRAIRQTRFRNAAFPGTGQDLSCPSHPD